MRFTQTKRLFKDSGQLTDSNSVAVLPNQIFVFTIDPRFIPYDEAMIVNLNDDNDVSITVNNRHKSSLPAGTQTQLNGYNITDVRVKNNGSTNIEIGELKLFYRHTSQEGKNKIEKFQTGVQIVSGLKILGL